MPTGLHRGPARAYGWPIFIGVITSDDEAAVPSLSHCEPALAGSITLA